MEQRQFVSALQMYKNCMNKFGRQRDVQLMMYITRAFWKAGKYAECRDYVEKSIIEAPENLLIKLNHAVVLQRMATNVLKDEKSNLPMVTNAVEDLKNAERIFTFISGTSAEVIVRYKYISRTICANEASACNDLLKQARTYLQRAQAKDEEERRQRERQEEERRAIERQREEEERQRQEEKMRELAALKAMRQHYVEKTKEILKMHPAPSQSERKSAGGGRSRKRREDRDEFLNDSSDLGEYADGGESRRKEKKVRRKRERAEGSGAASSDDGRAPPPRRKRPAAKEVDDTPARMRGKIKSKAFLSSSSSSDSDNNDAAAASQTRPRETAPALGSDDDEEEEQNEDVDAGDDAPMPSASSSNSDEDSEPMTQTAEKRPTAAAAALSSSSASASKASDSDNNASSDDSVPASPVKKSTKRIESDDEEDDE